MIDANEGGWNDHGPGVKVKRLGGEDGAGFYLMRMDPGAVVPRHSHPQRETILVLEGYVEASTWPLLSDPERRHVDRHTSISLSYRDFPPDEEHELRAHPTRGALLLDVARPDWPAS